MGARYYEQKTSGMNIDRFLDQFDDSTVLTMKRHYWTAKQLLRAKLGKKEDEHLLASDADLDSKLTLFRSVRDTSEGLLACIENYQMHMFDATLVENQLGKFMKEQSRQQSRAEPSVVLRAVGRALLFCSHERAALRNPLVRFYSELHVFAERAIADCAQTVSATEKARTAYRGSLLWLKDSSQELDPERQIDRFREAQAAVKANKERLDQLKLDTLQKVDLLATSRSSLLAHVLDRYQTQLLQYYEKTARAYAALSENLSIFQYYEFDFMTDITDPLKKKNKEAERERLKENKKKFEKSPIDADDGKWRQMLFGSQSPPPQPIEEQPERTESPLGILLDDETKNSPSNLSIYDKMPSTSEANCSEPAPALLQMDDRCPPEVLAQNDQNTGQDLFDLLDLHTAPTPFPNPFNEEGKSEWDLLLAQYDGQSHTTNDLI